MVERFWEDRRLRRDGALGSGGSHVLRFVVKTVNPGEVAFRDQFRLGRQPMLHVAPLRRTFVQISEVGPPGNFVR